MGHPFDSGRGDFCLNTTIFSFEIELLQRRRTHPSAPWREINVCSDFMPSLEFR